MTHSFEVCLDLTSLRVRIVVRVRVCQAVSESACVVY